MSLRERLLVLILAIGGFAATANAVVLVPTLQPIADQFHTSDALAGQIGTAYSIMSGLTALIVAQWIDRFSRRSLLRVGTAIITIGTLSTALAPDLVLLFAGRAITGLGGALILPTCIAATGDLFTEPSKRNRAVSTVWAATSLTLLIGLPVLTQIAAITGWRWTVTSVLIPFGVLLIGTQWLPAHAPMSTADASNEGGLRKVLSHASAVWLLVAVALFWLVFIGTYSYWGAFFDEHFHATANEMTLLFLVGGAADLFGTYTAPVALRWRSPRFMLLTCSAIFGANLIAIGFIYSSLWSFFPYMVVSGAASGALVVYASILLLDALPSVRGAMMSLSASGNSLGGAAGTALAGGLLAVQGYIAVYVGLGLLIPVMIGCLIASFALAKTGLGTEANAAGVAATDSP